MIRTRPEPVLLTIVILAHNKSSLTRDCLDALSRVTADIEVILVDNASTDDTPAVARAFTRQLPGLRVERFARNLAYAAANNRAVRRAAGDTLLFLNNDVVVAPEAPQRLVAAVAASGGGIVGPKLLFPGSRTVQHAGMRQMLWGYASNFGTGGAPGEAMLNQGGPIFAVTGAMLSIGRRLFERLGGFDERFRWGYEDVDLCLKARQAGAAVSYAPEIESVHAESATLSASRRPVESRGELRAVPAAMEPCPGPRRTGGGGPARSRARPPRRRLRHRSRRARPPSNAGAKPHLGGRLHGVGRGPRPILRSSGRAARRDARVALRSPHRRDAALLSAARAAGRLRSEERTDLSDRRLRANQTRRGTADTSSRFCAR